MSASDSLLSVPRRWNRAVDRWLTAPEDHAAGRLGLFRIVFALFYLWQFSSLTPPEIGRAPNIAWTPIFADRMLRSAPPAAFFQVGEFILVFCLILLLIGYRVRLTTVVILVVGVTIEGFRYSFGKVDHDSLFLTFYIPLFMSLSRWGETYSLDAALNARRGAPAADPSDSSWRFGWPIRAVLLVLVFLFASAAFWKVARGSWAHDPMTLANLLMRQNVSITAGGGVLTPLALLPVRIPLLGGLMQAGMLAFESLFFLSLFSRNLRNWFISFAFIFHTFNVLLLHVTFAQQMTAYLLFVDWQRLYDRWMPERVRRLRSSGLSAAGQVGAALAATLVLTLLWTLTPVTREIIRGGELITSTTIWYWALPFALVAVCRNTIELLGTVSGRIVTKRTPAAV